MAVNVTELNNRLSPAGDTLRANSKLKSSEYAVPVWGPILLRHDVTGEDQDRRRAPLVPG
jgi:type I restriction enzyme M protein